MKDKLGQDIQLGDTIVTPLSGYLAIGHVTSFASTGVNWALKPTNQAGLFLARPDNLIVLNAQIEHAKTTFPEEFI